MRMNIEKEEDQKRDGWILLRVGLVCVRKGCGRSRVEI